MTTLLLLTTLPIWMMYMLFIPAGIVGLVGLIIWVSEQDTPEQSKQRNAIHREPLYDKVDKIHWV